MNQRNRDYETTRIDPRFNGPPGIGNGGIVCALLAEHCGDTFEAELRLPAPLDRALQIERSDGGNVELREGESLIARARACGELELDVPPTPSWREAEDAHLHALRAPHPFPHCFVCGPKRGAGEGLRVIGSPVPDRGGLVATLWRPHAAFVDRSTGLVDARFVWAALDCPGGIAALGGRCVPILLARLRGRIERCPRAGERCMLIGWPLEQTGRKHVTGTALIDADGAVLGRAEALWIEARSDSG